MSVSFDLNSLNIPPRILEAKQNLNKDFFKHAKINGLVSILYYPGQLFCPMGHAELHVEDKCYTILPANIKSSSLSKKLTAVQRGALPFKQCFINITPEQLAKIKQNLPNSRSLSTCMHGVSRALSRSANFHINLSPLLSYLYLAEINALKTSKNLKNKRIQKIESHGSMTKNLIIFLCVSLGYSVKSM